MQSCGSEAATPDCLQFSARHQSPAVGKYGPAIVRLQQQSRPRRALVAEPFKKKKKDNRLIQIYVFTFEKVQEKLFFNHECINAQMHN